MAVHGKLARESAELDPSGEEISLGSTFNAFESRLQRKLKEQEQREDISARLREERHGRMLKAMNTIRRALQDTCKIRLGERFHFTLDVVDWQGWPRVELILVDRLAPARDDFGLIVSANDHNEQGNVVVTNRAGRILARVELRDPEEMKRLPLLLKKTVRDFLDAVAEYVLNPIDPEELLEVQTQNIESEQLDEIDSALQQANLFSEDVEAEKQNLVESDPDEPGDGITLTGENLFK